VSRFQGLSLDHCLFQPLKLVLGLGYFPLPHGLRVLDDPGGLEALEQAYQLSYVS